MTNNNPDGRIIGRTERIHRDEIIGLTPKDGFAVFITPTGGGTIGVALMFDDERLGRFLIQLSGRDLVGLHKAVEWAVNLSDDEIDAIIAETREGES